jgi:hypothetical protein
VRRHPAWLGLLVLLALAPAAGVAAEPEATQYHALISDPRIGEISGFAASRQHPGIIWTHNDSGDLPALYALDESSGEVRARLHLRGARHVDWEDLALRREPDGDLLLIADTGDNGGLRQELAVYAVREPAALANGRPQVEWRMRFRWPDGARDCEALAVDRASGELLLISKKRVPPEIFRLPAKPSGNRLEVAEPVGLLHGVEQPNADDLQRNPVYGRYRSQITAADSSPDGHWLAVLNYRRVMLYQRLPDEPWGHSVGRAPQVLRYPWLPQAEAISFSPDGRRLLIGSEKLPVPLIELAVPAATPQNQTPTE